MTTVAGGSPAREGATSGEAGPGGETGEQQQLAADERPPLVAGVQAHGGGFVLGSAFGYRALAGALASAAGASALVPEFRLAPEHPFPAALDDARRAYQWMLERGTDPGRWRWSATRPAAGWCAASPRPTWTATRSTTPWSAR